MYQLIINKFSNIIATKNHWPVHIVGRKFFKFFKFFKCNIYSLAKYFKKLFGIRWQ